LRLIGARRIRDAYVDIVPPVVIDELSDHFAGKTGGDRIIYVLRPQIVSHQLIATKVHLQRRGAAVRFKVHLACSGCRLQHLLDFLGEIFQLSAPSPYWPPTL
jgi:hypothetical protein